ncbi:hypothetical protein ACTLMW_002805 [Enterobacter roggenkampii]
MKLIELLVQKLGGWPTYKKHHTFIAQDNDGELWAFPSAPTMNKKRGDWEIDSGDGCYLCNLDVADDNKEAIITREQYEAALAASKLKWDGEGLPPVGCEFLFGTHQTKAKCIAVGRDVIFASTGNPDEKDGFYEEFVISIHHSEFRPFRSEADKKREIIISMIEKAYKGCPHSDAVPHAIYEAIAEHIRID